MQNLRNTNIFIDQCFHWEFLWVGSSYCTTLEYTSKKCKNTLWRNTEKYKKTTCSRGIARRSTSASRPSSRLGLAMLLRTRTPRSFTPSSWCSLAVSQANLQVSHVLGGLQKTNFWSSPLMCRQPPPTCGTTISLYLSVVVVNQLHTTQVQSMML